MERPRFDIVASGERMREIRRQRNISVKQVMEYMGFESTQAVYKCCLLYTSPSPRDRG